MVLGCRAATTKRPGMLKLQRCVPVRHKTKKRPPKGLLHKALPSRTSASQSPTSRSKLHASSLLHLTGFHPSLCLQKLRPGAKCALFVRPAFSLQKTMKHPKTSRVRRDDNLQPQESWLNLEDFQAFLPFEAFKAPFVLLLKAFKDLHLPRKADCIRAPRSQVCGASSPRGSAHYF